MADDHKTIRIATLNTLNNPDRIEERAEMMLEELRTINPDIITLQEVMRGVSFNLGDFIRRGLGYGGMVTGDFVASKRPGISYGNVTIARNTIDIFRSLGRCTTNEREVPALAISTVIDKQRVEVINGHFIWGGDAEAQRLAQALQADKHARRVLEKRSESLVLIAGDFNATPMSPTNLFFNGLYIAGTHSTYWVDAYDCNADPEIERTARIDNYYARKTAEGVGIKYPEMLPHRRIDYIKSFGWTYGKTGSPISLHRWADSRKEDGLDISDHYGLWADILVL